MHNKHLVWDTNIWVSFFIKKRFEEIVDLVYGKEIVLYSSQELIDELREVLSRDKFSKYLTLPLDEYMNFHQEITQFITIEKQYQDCPDPKDNFLFDLCLQSEAQVIVTGDKLLLSLEVQKVSIISLNSFYEQISLY